MSGPDEALLLLDLQTALLSSIGEEERALLVGAAAEAAEAARRRGSPVIHVRTVFRPGHPEISERNQLFAGIAAAGILVDGDPGSEFDPALSPEADDLVVTKKRISAFAGSDLELVLGSRGIARIAIGGFATSGAVLSTVRAAADRDLGIVVLADATADPDPEVQRVLIEKVFPAQAEVSSVGAWK